MISINYCQDENTQAKLLPTERAPCTLGGPVAKVSLPVGLHISLSGQVSKVQVGKVKSVKFTSTMEQNRIIKSVRISPQDSDTCTARPLKSQFLVDHSDLPSIQCTSPLQHLYTSSVLLE